MVDINEHIESKEREMAREIKNSDYEKGFYDGIKFSTEKYLEPIKNLADFKEICGQAIAILLTKNFIENEDE